MWKDKIKNIGKYVFILICICAFGVFIYPGLYRYDKLDQKYPVMINRITGETKVLSGGVWETVGNVDAQMSKFQDYKEEVLIEIQSRNIDVKNDVLESIKGELEAAKEEVIAQTSENIEANNVSVTGANFDFDLIRQRDYTGERFGKGDTQETVKSIMGVPDSITGAGQYETWFYDYSTVSFENGKVNGWNNSSENLYLK